MGAGCAGGAVAPRSLARGQHLREGRDVRRPVPQDRRRRPSFGDGRCVRGRVRRRVGAVLELRRHRAHRPRQVRAVAQPRELAGRAVVRPGRLRVPHQAHPGRLRHPRAFAGDGSDDRDHRLPARSHGRHRQRVRRGHDDGRRDLRPLVHRQVPPASPATSSTRASPTCRSRRSRSTSARCTTSARSA